MMLEGKESLFSHHMDPIIWMMLEALVQVKAHHMDDVRGVPQILCPSYG